MPHPVHTQAEPIAVVSARPERLVAVLGDHIRRLREHAPLAPIHVLAGSVLLRPFLTQSLADDGGALGVRVSTLGEFGAGLGGARLSSEGRRFLDALSARALAAAVSRAATGYFEVVGAFAGFADAARRTTRDLRLAGVTPEVFVQVAAGAAESAAKAEGLIDLYSRMEQARAPFWDGVDGLAFADPDAFDGAALILYGVTSVPDVAKRVIEAIAQRVPVIVMLPHFVDDEPMRGMEDMLTWLHGIGATEETVEPEAGDRESTSLTQLQQSVFSKHPDEAPTDDHVRFVSAPDPVAEVREAVRACLDWAEDGIPFRDMAITYRQAEPYEPIIEAVLDEAGIPAYLHHGSSLAERPLGRRVLGLLDLIESGMGRREVVALLSDGPQPAALRDRSNRVPSGPKVDKVSRELGVIGGIDSWMSRLDAGIADGKRREAEPDAPNWVWQVPKDLTSLRGFVVALDARIKALPAEGTWAQCAEALKGLITTYISDDDPDLGFLDAFARADDQVPRVPFSEFVALLRHDLEEGVFRTTVGDPGAFRRRGINVLDVNQVSKLGFRAVAILGIGERQFPPPPRQDPLLLDEERTALNAALGKPAGEGLPLRAFGPDPEPLLFALAVNAASDRLLLSYARSDGSGASGSLPSSFFMRAASAVAGRRLRTADFESGLGARLLRIPASRIGAPGLPVLGRRDAMDVDYGRALTIAEWDRTLVESDGEVSQVGKALLDRIAPDRAPRARELTRARWSPALTAFDGLTASPQAIAAIKDGHEGKRPFSATRLERYAGCPMRYLYENVLGMKVVEEPEGIVEADKREVGTLVHSILERFVVDAGEDPPSEANRATLEQLMSDIAEEEFALFKKRGLAGAPLIWQVVSKELMGDLFAWLQHEIDNPRNPAQHHVEVSFGMEVRREGQGWAKIDFATSLSKGEPLTLDVVTPPVRVSGMIDRLDAETLDPGYSVIDYKTGAGKKGKDGQLGKGTALQLPLYLLGGQFILGRDPVHGTAEYVNFSRRNGFKSIVFDGYDLKTRRDDLDKALRIIVEGVRGGDFHPEPSQSECRYCDFDSLCDSARGAQAERKANDPLVQRYRELRDIE